MKLILTRWSVFPLWGEITITLFIVIISILCFCAGIWLFKDSTKDIHEIISGIFPVKTKTHIALRIINICEMGMGGLITAFYIIGSIADTFFTGGGYGLFVLFSLPCALIVIIGHRGYKTNNTLRGFDIVFILLLSIYGIQGFISSISATNYISGSTWVDHYLNNIHVLVYDLILTPLLIAHLILAYLLTLQIE